jgi:bis(5'-nucleosyl)-tetraphosphatase (symmetrical)
MSTYVIGDIQGCFQPLLRLLEVVNFQPHTDHLWLTGDLVNRGPDSLAVLRFLTRLPNKPTIVLGNHDLHLLAVYSGKATMCESDTLEEILLAPDAGELCHWLRCHPLVYLDLEYGYTLVHAGFPPQWTGLQAKQHAQEVEKILMGTQYQDLLAQMYGETPNFWDEKLAGAERLRFIINALTRIRFCSLNGTLNFSKNTVVGLQSEGLYPWFEIPNRANDKEKIIFGHWAALRGKANAENVFSLDTGCVWGQQLTAMRLEDQQIFAVQCPKFSNVEES